ARHQTHRVRRYVSRAPALDEARELARRRIFWTFRVHPDRRAVDDTVAPSVVADDVVVQHGVDTDLLGDGLLGVQPRANQALLLTHVTHEHERRVEIDATLREDARKLDRERGAAAVVVDAGREGVERRIRIVDRYDRRVGIAERRTRRVGGSLSTGARHSVVMAA